MTFATNYKQPERASPRKTRNRKNDEATKAGLPAQREILFLWALEGSIETGVYGLDLQRAINESSGGFETVSHGTLYSTLKRLKHKGWIDSYEGDALGGGAKRVYYRLTKDGEEQLARVNQFFSRLREWQPAQN